MVHKEHIENFLRINGVSTSAPEEEIRGALVAARWHERDVDAAIMVLRGEAENPDLTVTSIHSVLHPEKPVAPETISALLGVSHTIKQNERRPRFDVPVYREYTLPTWVIILLLASVVAVAVALFTMYILTIGPFYSPVDQFNF